MKQGKIVPLLACILILALGLTGVVTTRAEAIADTASNSDKMLFSLSLIAILVGFASAVTAVLPKRRDTDVRTLVSAAMFAALSYVGFAYMKIDIPVGGGSTAFHLGNVFVVLAALFLGSYWGGMAGAVGLTIADLTTQYVTSAPKTFVLKLCIGLIAGFVAHKIFKISKEQERKIPVSVATAISCSAGMAFNVVADPVVGYFYKTYLLGVPQDAAKIWAKMGAVTTLVNALVAVVAATVFYLALRPALKHASLMKTI